MSKLLYLIFASLWPWAKVLFCKFSLGYCIVMFHVPQLTWNQTIWQPNKGENITKKQFHFLFILFKPFQTFAKREIVWLIIVQQRSFLQNYAFSIFPVFYENQWTASKYLLHSCSCKSSSRIGIKCLSASIAKCDHENNLRLQKETGKNILNNYLRKTILL